MRAVKVGLVAASLCLFSGTVQAQMQGLGEREGWLLGFGVIADFPAYDDTDSPEMIPIPYIAYEWENAHLGIDGFSYDFLGTENFELTALVEPRWSFTDPEDSPLFENIDRDTALEAGLGATLNLGNFYLQGQALQDISGVHEGHESSVSVGFEQDLGAFAFDLEVGAVYRNDDLNLHLYGVKADEETASLTQYAPGETVHPYTEANLMMPIGDSMGLIAFGRVEQFEDEIKDSPLVSRDTEGTVGLVFLKQF